MAEYVLWIILIALICSNVLLWIIASLLLNAVKDCLETILKVHKKFIDDVSK